MTWHWWYISWIPCAWFVQLMIHELSHAFMGTYVEGRACFGIYPYPHYFKGKFYFARYECGEATKRNSSPMLRHISPVIFGVIWALLCSITALLLNYAVPFIFGAFGIFDALWFTWGMLFGSFYCDGKRFLRSIRR